MVWSSKDYYWRNKEKCREKWNKKRREWYANNKKKIRDSILQSTYGITLGDYNKMFEEQGSCCAICGKHQRDINRILFVDHSHKTGKVRGLLCISCNYNLGWYEKCKKKVDNYLKNN